RVRHKVHAASFDFLAPGAVLEICVVTGAHGPELKVRSRDHAIDFVLGMTTHFRVVPVLDVDTYRALCGVLDPGEEPEPAMVTGFLRNAVAQSPAVLSRTHACAA
ncbi:hypothetical protein, partial [Rhodococcus chondri]